MTKCDAPLGVGTGVTAPGVGALVGGGIMVGAAVGAAVGGVGAADAVGGVGAPVTAGVGGVGAAVVKAVGDLVPDGTVVGETVPPVPRQNTKLGPLRVFLRGKPAKLPGWQLSIASNPVSGPKQVFATAQF